MQIARITKRLMLVALLCVAGVRCAHAQGGRPASTTPPGAVMQAKITKDAASTTAVGKVPGGKVQSISLGTVGGKLAYTAFVVVAGKPGRTTVVVDATSGAVTSVRP